MIYIVRQSGDITDNDYKNVTSWETRQWIEDVENI